MEAHPSVLVGLCPDLGEEHDLQQSLGGWVQACGFQPRFTARADEAESWLRDEREAFAASFLDAEMGLGEGRVTWRVVRSWVGRRLVLVVRERRRDLWFEALRAGVRTVLTCPPEEATVRAALHAVAVEPGSEQRNA